MEKTRKVEVSWAMPQKHGWWGRMQLSDPNLRIPCGGYTECQVLRSTLTAEEQKSIEGK